MIGIQKQKNLFSSSLFEYYIATIFKAAGQYQIPIMAQRQIKVLFKKKAPFKFGK
jgi:hypothetical protein